VDADRTDDFVIQNDVRLRYTGAAAVCSPTVRTGCVASEVFLYNTPLTQKTQMRNFAAFVQDRASYNRVTLNLGLRWSYYDGNIPAQANGGAEWGAACAACNQSFPETKPPYNWNTIAPRTGVVFKLTEDGKNVAKASYSRYYESMYTSEYAAINGNGIVTTGVATYNWAGAFTPQGLPVLGSLKSQFVAKQNSIDPKLKDPRNDEIMFAFQRELMNNVSFSADWIQRWFNDYTVDQNCYGLPGSQTASTAYVQNKAQVDPGPDNIGGTSDDRNLTFWQVAPAFLGKDSTSHTNCGNNVSVSCTQRYKAAEFSISKRMSNRWQAQGSYVWSQLDGDLVLDYTNPNNLIPFIGNGRGANDQPQAFKVLGSYQAPWNIIIGANFQSLIGLPRDRTLNVALAQGTAALRMEERGTYRADTLNLLSLRADKGFRFGGHRRIGRGGGRCTTCSELQRRPVELRHPDAELRQPGGVRRGAQDHRVLRSHAGDHRSARVEVRIQAGLLESRVASRKSQVASRKSKVESQSQVTGGRGNPAAGFFQTTFDSRLLTHDF
jgi:hypothetical protein